MKKLIASLLILTVFWSTGALAGGEYDAKTQSSQSEYGELQYFDFDLSVELDDGIVKLEWNDFPSDAGFQWYKVMYSNDISSPVYPDQSAVYVWSKRTDVNHKIALKRAENHYFRICTITLNDDYSKERFCGKVEKVFTNLEEKQVEEKKEYTQRYKDIEYYDFDFQVEVSDAGKVTTRWNSYLKDRGFQYYKLLYSTKYANPSYPELSAKYVGSDITDSGNSFSLSSGENHYFRLCAITNEGYGVTGRYCSNTRKVSRAEEDYPNQEIKEEKKSTPSYNSVGISDALKEKVDDRLNVFVMNLKEKSYSSEEIVAVLDQVIGKLDRYKEIEKYEAIAKYMQTVLLEYREIYENQLDIFEDIFGEY